MSSGDSLSATKLKVGIFTILSVILVFAVTVFVNDRPFWWKGCQLVHINVPDATGLRQKSPVRSLGLQIGYIKSVGLTEDYVTLGICITAPVQVLPSTRAYIHGEGFLGDKFVELKPVKYIGTEDTSMPRAKSKKTSWLDWLVPSAHAQQGGREIPVGDDSRDMEKLVSNVDSLVKELTDLTRNLKTAIHPDELRSTMKQLNKTLDNAAKAFSPEGNLTSTAQRALAKLEDAIEQMRDTLTRINQGKGSVGRIINDDVFADQLLEAMKNVNRLLSKVGGMRFIVNIGGEKVLGYSSGRGTFHLSIWPVPDRYYRLGISVDPRGSVRTVTTTTTVGAQSTVTDVTTVEPAGLLFTAMLGKTFWNRMDFSIGLLHSDGAIGWHLLLGPSGEEERLRLENYGYSTFTGPNTATRIDYRGNLVLFPMGGPMFRAIYLRGGIDSLRQVNGKWAFSFGAGIEFDDSDIKFLFSFL